MARPSVSILAALLVSSMLVWPAMAADVTSKRLLNPDKEPQNWLVNHRTYDGQRFSCNSSEQNLCTEPYEPGPVDQ
jgi:hypothetical protein